MVLRIPHRLHALISRMESGTDASARSTTCCGSSCSSSMINYLKGRICLCLSLPLRFALRFPNDTIAIRLVSIVFEVSEDDFRLLDEEFFCVGAQFSIKGESKFKGVKFSKGGTYDN